MKTQRTTEFDGAKCHATGCKRKAITALVGVGRMCEKHRTAYEAEAVQWLPQAKRKVYHDLRRNQYRESEASYKFMGAYRLDTVTRFKYRHISPMEKHE